MTEPMSPAMAISRVLSDLRAEAANMRESALPVARAVEIGIIAGNRCGAAVDCGNRDDVAKWATKAARHFAYVAAACLRGESIEAVARPTPDYEPPRVRGHDFETPGDANEARRNAVVSQVFDAISEVPRTGAELRALVPMLRDGDLEAWERAGVIRTCGDGWEMTPTPGIPQVGRKCGACSGPLVGDSCPTCAGAAKAASDAPPQADGPGDHDTTETTAPAATTRKRREEPARTAAEWYLANYPKRMSEHTGPERDAFWAAMGETRKSRGWPAAFTVWLAESRAARYDAEALQHRAAEGAPAASGEGHEVDDGTRGGDERREVEDEQGEQHAGAMPVEGATL